MHTVYSTIETQGERKTLNITWTVPNFLSHLSNDTTRELRTSRKNPEHFQLKIKFVGHSKETFEIYYLSENPVFLELTLKKCYKTRQEIIVTVEPYRQIDAKKWQYLHSLSKTEFVNLGHNREAPLLEDGSLSVKFRFIFFNDIKVAETELNNNFQYLLSNGVFSDVTMKSGEGKQYKVHKAVLASRSAVLKAHFKHNTAECITNVLESPLESEVLNEVLTFIYSDQAPMVDEIPDKLLVAADYYQLNRLKNLCEEALHKKLTVENAIQTLQLAYIHSANTLLEHTLEFIKDVHAKAITKTEEWAKISSVELIKKIYGYVTEDNNIIYNE